MLFCWASQFFGCQTIRNFPLSVLFKVFLISLSVFLEVSPPLSLPSLALIVNNFKLHAAGLEGQGHVLWLYSGVHATCSLIAMYWDSYCNVRKLA